MHLAPIKQSKQTPPKPLPRSASASASPMPFLPRLGELLVAAGFMSAEALESGLARQQRHNRKLGELIVELGMLSQADLDAVLAIQDDIRAGRAEDLAAMVNNRLGTILVSSHMVSQRELDLALVEVERSGRQLGAVLVAHGVLTTEQLHGALVTQRRRSEAQPERFKLGRLLVESGDISEEVLRDAMARQALTGRKLGETLVDLGLISQAALSAALARQRRLISATMAAVSFLMAGSMPTLAQAGSTRMQVSATIMTHASMRVANAPTEVAVSAADIARGYVDVEQAIDMQVKTNAEGGCLLGISLNSPAFTGAEVRSAAGTTRVNAGAATLTVARQGHGMRTEALSLRLRLELARDAVPGIIAMPVTLSLTGA